MKLYRWLLPLLLLIALPLSGAYLTFLPKVLTQPDGTVLNCFASGDEYHNWLHDADNYTIIKNPDTGYYTYAQKDGESVKPSTYIVGRDNPAALGIAKGINWSPELTKRIRDQRWANTRDAVRNPTTGLINNLVVFIRFSDETEFSIGLSTYSTMFNNPTPNTNSMHNYFLEDSYQALDITTAFYPQPVNDVIVSYQDTHPRSYFEPYSSFNLDGYNGESERESRELILLQNAIAFIAPNVPTSLDLDSDDDGRIDNVCFIVRGATGEWADLLWPHMWVMEDYPALINGAQVYTFNFQLEDALVSSGVGVLCHEMSHSLGFPDLYHYSYDGFTTVGRWDLMENNQNPPQNHSAYMKSRYGNWLPPMQTLTQSGTYYVNKMLHRENNCFKILSNNPQYFYVVEFRKKQGLFENSINGSGLVVYRVNTALDGIGNAEGPPDELYVYRPNGTPTNNGTTNTAHFSLEVNRTAINESTNPTPFLGDGSQGGLNITQIGSSAGDSISFHLELPIAPPSDFDEGFETGNFNTYPWSFSGNSNWVIDSNVFYQGTHSAKSGAINHNQTSILMLTMNVPTDGNIGFMKKVSSETGYDYLKFKIDGALQSQWSGDSNWSYVQYPVAVGEHIFEWSYNKDQGSVGGSDCAWIDNISFLWEDTTTFLPPANFTAVSLPEDVANTLYWEAPAATTAVISGYRVFRNDIQIADVDSSMLNYWDFNVVPNNSYAYYVKTLYSSPSGHSIASETIEVTVLGQPVIPNLTNADIVDTNSVHLLWSLPVQLRGVVGFQIYRNGGLLHTIDNSATLEYTDADLNPGTYNYQIAARYPAFTSDLSAIMTVTIEPVSNPDNPTPVVYSFAIQKCYPNPFRQNATIQYSIDKGSAPFEVSIFNLKGQKVKSLKQGVAKSGLYSINWDGKDMNGKTATAGIYYCRLQNAKQTSVQKLILIK